MKQGKTTKPGPAILHGLYSRGLYCFQPGVSPPLLRGGAAWCLIISQNSVIADGSAIGSRYRSTPSKLPLWDFGRHATIRSLSQHGSSLFRDRGTDSQLVCLVASSCFQQDQVSRFRSFPAYSLVKEQGRGQVCLPLSLSLPKKTLSVRIFLKIFFDFFQDADFLLAHCRLGEPN